MLTSTIDYLEVFENKILVTGIKAKSDSFFAWSKWSLMQPKFEFSPKSFTQSPGIISKFSWFSFPEFPLIALVQLLRKSENLLKHQLMMKFN